MNVIKMFSLFLSVAYIKTPENSRVLWAFGMRRWKYLFM